MSAGSAVSDRVVSASSTSLDVERVRELAHGSILLGLSGLMLFAPWEAWSTGLPWYTSLALILGGLAATVLSRGSLRWRALAHPWCAGLGLFAVMVIVATFASARPDLSWRLLRKEFLIYAAAFLGVTLGVRTMAELRRLLHVVALSGLIACSCSIVTYHFYLHGADDVTRQAWVRDNIVDHDEPANPQTLRAQFPLQHHNKLGFMAALTALMVIYLGVGANGHRWLWWLSAMIPLWSLMLTLNRGALVGLVAAVLIVATMTNWRVAAGLAGAVLLVVVAVVPGHVRRHYETIFEPSTYRESWTSMQYRLRGWRSSWNMIHAHPLTGIGYSWTVYESQYPRYAVPDEVQIKPHAHNIWIEMASETGLIGGGGFALFHFGLFGATWRLWRPRRRRAPWITHMLTVQLLIIIVGLISFYMREQLGAVIWVLLAMGVVTVSLPELRENPAP
jgi:hypothetical protein